MRSGFSFKILFLLLGSLISSDHRLLTTIRILNVDDVLLFLTSNGLVANRKKNTSRYMMGNPACHIMVC